MNQVALVCGAMSLGQDHGSVSCACLGIDLSSVHSAPFEEFIGLYIDLFDKASSLLGFLDGLFRTLEPVIVVGLEIGVDGQPSRPIFFAHPRDGYPN